MCLPCHSNSTSNSNMMLKLHFSFLFIILNSYCDCLDPISGAVTAVGVFTLSLGYASYDFFKCKYHECCDDNWIHFDEKKLAENLNQKLFGQHLADSIIKKTLRGYYSRKNPKKALVMSFHGLTGSGKNYVADIIKKSIYKMYETGKESAYVHLYSGSKDFTHKAKVPEYQDRLREDIIHFTKRCGRSLFIFDEIDKMPPGTLDALKPFIDYYEPIDGVDYRNNIFIFLSNAGSSSIVALTLMFWAEGKEREEIKLKDIEPLINKGAFNEKGGFQYSELLRSGLVDVFVPFLPLEKKHVKKCIKVELEARGKSSSEKFVSQIAEELLYFPPESELYSTSGCKRLEQKVDMYVD